MQHGQLLSHIDTDLVTREQLALVETPDATRSFKPVPHIELINTLDEVLGQNQIAIRKEQFALRRDGSTLFGVLQLPQQDGRPVCRARQFLVARDPTEPPMPAEIKVLTFDGLGTIDEITKRIKDSLN